MSKSYGEWLRKQRQARGWNVPEMCRQLRRAARMTGDKLPANHCLSAMIRRWENSDGGVSERYRLHYCKAFRLTPEEFGKAPSVVSLGLTSNVTPLLVGALTTIGSNFAAADSSRQGDAEGVTGDAMALTPGPCANEVAGRSLIECEVLMTAHEGSEHAEHAERRDIGDATLEQLRAEVIRLSREYMTGEPLPLFFEMRRIRTRLYLALDRRIWPRDQAELYFLLGSLSALMADTADDLGSPAAAEELARAGWAYATMIDHKPLKAWLRIELATIARWNGQPRRCRDMALSGLEYLSTGPHGAQLHLLHAIAAARLGDEDTVRFSIAAATQAREHDYSDDLLEIGGELGFSRASQHYYAGSAAVDLPGGELEAITQLEQAIQLYAAGPEPGEHHSVHCRMKALADLASARLRAGQLDAAETAAALVLGLPPSQRIATLPRHLDRVRAELATPRYHGSLLAGELDEQIEQFCRDTIAAQLGDLPTSEIR